MKLWLKSKNVKFTVNGEEKSITGIVDMKEFINVAIEPFDGSMWDSILHNIYKKNSIIKIHKEMLTSTVVLPEGEVFDKISAKKMRRTIMLKLNMHLAKYRELLVKKTTNELYLYKIKNFKDALKAEYMK